jgi:hypothetical protein
MCSVNHGEKIAPVAAAATALATLACCLPVGIAAAAATASLAAVVAEHRVWFLFASGVLLAVGAVPTEPRAASVLDTINADRWPS